MIRACEHAAAACFWSCAAATAWVLVLYPAALLLLPRRRWARDQAEPTVSVVVPAHDEREPLAEKLASLAELDYPSERLQLIVVSDGSAAIAALARKEAPDAIVIELGERAGKPAALNAGLDAATGEIIVLSDSHSLLCADALRVAVRHFADPAVEAVSGRWRERGSAYDRYEHLLRLLETRSGSVASVYGGFLAIRAAGAERLPQTVVNDDLWLLCRIVRGGGRVIYEPGVVMTEAPLPTRAAIERRARISAGRAQLAGELRGLPAGFALRLGSHKFGRLALPFLLLGAQVSALALARRRPAYRRLARIQLGAHAAGAAAAAGVVPSAGPLRAAGQFTLGNLSVASGVVRALRRRQDVRWRAVR